MNPGKPIDMRHTKLNREEAALIAGEIIKPSWASRNEGIHERISFEDTLWGFEMAGGAFYKTPLRVAYVRPDSRAEKACIRMGDTVLRINGRDTSDLTLQEAHQLVLDAGINLKIVVTSPDDHVNAHYDYQDPLAEAASLTAEQLKQMELERVRRALERASRCRDLPWPWVRRKWVIYRESNCYMVPSKYENKHKDMFPELPAERLCEDFYPAKKINRYKNDKEKENGESKNNENDDNDEEEFEEVEEEVEEEEEQETEDKPDEFKQEDNDRLDNKNIENGSIQKESNISQEAIEENSSSKLDNEVENFIDENSHEESQPRNSEDSTKYEVDSNNNHVVKSKDEQTNEASQDEHDSDDNIINEIAASPGLVEVEENTPKSEDDIIDSVLNDNADKDSQNER